MGNTFPFEGNVLMPLSAMLRIACRAKVEREFGNGRAFEICRPVA